jgi:hypothetical protein
MGVKGRTTDIHDVFGKHCYPAINGRADDGRLKAGRFPMLLRDLPNS